MKNEELLLRTTKDLAPFKMVQKVSYGDITIMEVDWDLIGLQKALLAKAYPIIEKQWAEPVFNLLCDMGVCSKDAMPTTSEVLMALQEVIDKRRKQ